MIEATCTACGTVNRIADADVPVGAKFVNCASCKSRVAIGGSPGNRTIAGMTNPGAVRAPAPPPPPQSPALDLADLPAPRRGAALGGEPAAKPAPRSGLAAASAEPQLPVPRNKKSIAPPPGPGGALDLDDVLAPLELDGGADLLAPRPQGQRSSADLPAPKPKTTAADTHPGQRPGGGRAMTDIPVPGAVDTSPLADLPSPKPKGVPQLADLPAPKPRVPAMPPRVPAPPPPLPTAGITDLPGPKPKSAGITDLPGPKPKVPGVPAVPPLQRQSQPGIVDLPQPKQGIVDLPMPKPGLGDLPTPKQGQAGDLPAPKGFFEDLPQPARGGGQQKTNEVAPKGFFDDLPQPAKPGQQQTTNDVAPKGFFEDLPGRPSQPQQKPGSEVAPKGFFEDLPGRPNQQKPEAPAPKGFFEDLPGRPNQQKPEAPAPKGFFDDLPARPNQQKPEVPAPKGFFDDLPKPSATRSRDIELDLRGDPARSNAGLALELGDEEPLELAEDVEPEPPPVARMKAPSVAPAPGPSNQFDDLDLSSPSPVSFAKGGAKSGPTPGAQVATINPAAAAAAAAAVARPALPPIGGPKPDAALELEEPRKAEARTPSTKALTPKQVQDQRKKDAAKKTKASSGRSRKVAGLVLVGVLGLGAGGFFAYRHFAKQAEHESAVNEQLSAARKAIATNQWQKAASAAAKTLELDKKNAEAFGIRAEALFALGIAEGMDPARFAQARKTITAALEAGAMHPALQRAQALSPIAAGSPQNAVPLIEGFIKRAPKDVGLQLYLGWAHAATNNFAAAVKAFDAALASPAVKVHALYGRGRVKQLQNDLEGAKADYEAVLAVDKTHLGAQIGLASSQPAAKVQQMEADLLAILALKDIEKKQPRAALQAWVLVAEIARKGGRLDVARERYRKALVIQPLHLDALIGSAEVELRAGKLDVAADVIDKALKAAPTDLHANIVSLEILIAKKQLEEAMKRLDALTKRTPPPPVLDQARIKLLEARLLMARGKEQESIDAYLEAAKLAGDSDLTPTLEAAQVLNALAEKASVANDTARSSELRKRADELLEAISTGALGDPTLALTLGMAYLSADDAMKAEHWLRKAIELQPKNVDAMYQLAKALAAQKKDADAIGYLRNAVELDPTRTEIGIELARVYEDSNPPRDIDAEKLYDKLLGAKEPTLELRARAGRFFARVGQMEKAGEQGLEILKVQEDHPAGFYLKGEGLLKSGKTDAARKLFVQASDADPEAQYLDARGRADEVWAKESGNTTYLDDAIRVYTKATERDPRIFTSWLGLGRLYVARNADKESIDPLQKAWAIKQTAEVARLLGTAAKNLGEHANAAAWLERSFSLEPNAETAFRLGQVYSDPNLNKPKEAISAFDRATRLAVDQEKKTGQPVPWLTDALYQLGSIRAAAYDLKGAKQAWQMWLARNPKPGAQLKEVQNKMATELKDL